MKSAVDRIRPLFPKLETAAAFLIIAAFIHINLLVATHTPTVFQDEPQFADPAANLVLGNGFTSTVWGQDYREFCCSYDTMYHAVLAAFCKLFGFGLFQARVVSLLFTATGAGLFWAALRRTDFVETPGYRLLALGLVLSGSASTLTFRTIRPDAGMFFACALVFYSCSLQAQWRLRPVLILLASALLPAAGIVLLPYAGLVWLLYVVIYRGQNLRALVFIPLGVLTGIALLCALYFHFSSLHGYLQMILPNTAIGGIRQSGSHFWHDKIFGWLPGDDNFFTCFFGSPTEFFNKKILFDQSAALLFMVVVAIALKTWHKAANKDRKLMLLSVGVTLLVPPLLHFSGHYISYYRWLTYVPLALVVPRLIEILEPKQAGFFRPTICWVVGLALLLGLPAHTLPILQNWAARSHLPIERAAASMVQPTDVVICDYKVYFAVRPHAHLVFVAGMGSQADFGLIKNLPTNNVTLLALIPEEVDLVQKTVGGKWKKVPLQSAEELGKTRYNVGFYRRDLK